MRNEGLFLTRFVGFDNVYKFDDIWMFHVYLIIFGIFEIKWLTESVVYHIIMSNG